MANVTTQPGWFKASIELSKKLIRELMPVRGENPLPIYSDSLVKTVRGLPYFDEWRTYVNGSHYDVQLGDGGLFQFKHQPRDKTILSYAFFECPLVGMITYEEFIKEYFGADPDAGGDDVDASDEYETFLDQCERRPHVTPLRYDYSPDLYREGVHPAAHIHFGYGSEIRVSCKKQMCPLSFALFVIRQMYPEIWEKKFHLRGDASILVRQVRDELDSVDAKMFRGKDYWEISLD